MDQLVSVVMADDHDVFVEGISMLLDAEHDLTVVALARDARQAVAALHDHRPDVLVVDTHLPSEQVEQILGAAVAHSTRSLVLAEGWSPEAVHWLERGASTVVTKQASARQLAHAIRVLSMGQPPPAVPAVPPRQPSRQAPRRDGHIDLMLRSLSRREREILSLLVNGYSNRRIAEECVLSQNTVRAHVQNVLVKLGVHSKLEAAALAVHQGGGLSGLL